MLQVPVRSQVMRVPEEPPSKLVRPPRPRGEQEVSKPAGGSAPRTRERGGPEAVRGHIPTDRVTPPEADTLGPAGMALSLLGIMAGDLRELLLDSGNHVSEHGIQVVGAGSHLRPRRHPVMAVTRPHRPIRHGIGQERDVIATAAPLRPRVAPGTSGQAAIRQVNSATRRRPGAVATDRWRRRCHLGAILEHLGSTGSSGAHGDARAGAHGGAPILGP